MATALLGPMCFGGYERPYSSYMMDDIDFNSDNITTQYYSLKPWEPHHNGFIWFLNFILAFVFPVIPWEIFFVMPWLMEYLAQRAIKTPDVAKGKMAHLILFISGFAGFYGGIAHPLGLIQAFESLGGGDGICIVHPPPDKHARSATRSSCTTGSGRTRGAISSRCTSSPSASAAGSSSTCSRRIGSLPRPQARSGGCSTTRPSTCCTAVVRSGSP